MGYRIISRDEARQRGFSRYFTNKYCCNDHLSERRVSDGKCIGCIQLKKRMRSPDQKERASASSKRRYDKMRAAYLAMQIIDGEINAIAG